MKGLNGNNIYSVDNLNSDIIGSEEGDYIDTSDGNALTEDIRQGIPVNNYNREVKSFFAVRAKEVNSKTVFGLEKFFPHHHMHGE